MRLIRFLRRLVGTFLPAKVVYLDRGVDDDFYEEDEDLDKIRQAWDAAPKGLTGPTRGIDISDLDLSRNVFRDNKIIP